MYSSTILLSMVTLVSVASAQSGTAQMTWDNTYDVGSNSLDIVACSNGANGIETKYCYQTFSQVPTFNGPNGAHGIGGAFSVAGFNSPSCGTCYKITLGSQSINFIAIDHAGSGFNVATSMFNYLGGNMNAPPPTVSWAIQDPSICGLPAPIVPPATCPNVGGGTGGNPPWGGNGGHHGHGGHGVGTCHKKHHHHPGGPGGATPPVTGDSGSAQLRYITDYSDPNYSLDNVACSNGNNGVENGKYFTVGALGAPSVGGSFNIAGYNSVNCGTCFTISYQGNSVNMLAIDVGPQPPNPGFNIDSNAFATLVGSLDPGVVDVTYVQVDPAVCNYSP